MKRAEILVTAEGHVCRDRAAKHGEAENSFATIAAYWTVHLRARGILPPDKALEAFDAALLLGLLKVARVPNNPKHADNWVDLAGYAACGGELAMAEPASAKTTEEVARAYVERATLKRPKSREADPVEELTQAYYDGA
jgi:hypothetical protein